MTYSEQFTNRIKGYMYATSKYQNVLENENKTAVSMLNPTKGDKILHIAASGVNIKKYIDLEEIELIEVDQNEEFAIIGDVDFIDITQMPYDDNTFDKVIVIANFHHSNNTERELIYKEIFRILKPNGKFILGDVMKYSLQDFFLNGFVNHYNPNGHNGQFFDYYDLELFRKTGFSTKIENASYTWNFESKEELEDFAYNFFNIINLEKYKTYKEIKKYLVVNQTDEGKITWNWRLIYFIATKISRDKLDKVDQIV